MSHAPHFGGDAPLVRVVRELAPRRVFVHRVGAKAYARSYYRYELACTHVVERGQPGRTSCYCEFCAAPKPR